METGPSGHQRYNSRWQFTNLTNNVAGPTERGLLKRQTPGTSRHEVSGFGNYNSQKNWPSESFHFVFLISWNNQKDSKSADWQIKLLESGALQHLLSVFSAARKKLRCLRLPGGSFYGVLCAFGVSRIPFAEKVSNQILGSSAIPGVLAPWKFPGIVAPPLHPVECRCVMATCCSLSPKFCTKDESLVELQGS